MGLRDRSRASAGGGRRTRPCRGVVQVLGGSLRAGGRRAQEGIEPDGASPRSKIRGTSSGSHEGWRDDPCNGAPRRRSGRDRIAATAPGNRTGGPSGVRRAYGELDSSDASCATFRRDASSRSPQYRLRRGSNQPGRPSFALRRSARSAADAGASFSAHCRALVRPGRRLICTWCRAGTWGAGKGAFAGHCASCRERQGGDENFLARQSRCPG